jgi:hypothetical protein
MRDDEAPRFRAARSGSPRGPFAPGEPLRCDCIVSPLTWPAVTASSPPGVFLWWPSACREGLLRPLTTRTGLRPTAVLGARVRHRGDVAFPAPATPRAASVLPAIRLSAALLPLLSPLHCASRPYALPVSPCFRLSAPVFPLAWCSFHATEMPLARCFETYSCRYGFTSVS